MPYFSQHNSIYHCLLCPFPPRRPNTKQTQSKHINIVHFFQDGVPMGCLWGLLTGVIYKRPVVFQTSEAQLTSRHRVKEKKNWYIFLPKSPLQPMPSRGEAVSVADGLCWMSLAGGFLILGILRMPRPEVAFARFCIFLCMPFPWLLSGSLEQGRFQPLS